jgi:lysophospholipase L1-like esterase
MAGINDIYGDIPVATIFENYKAIVRRLRDNRITPVIHATLFVSPRWKEHVARNREVIKLDSLLSTYAAEEDIDHLDLNIRMSPGGTLREDLTYDGVHLNPRGYEIWRDELEKILRKFGL